MLKEQIERFLAERQVGIVGISHSREKFSNKVYQKLVESGYSVYPVHPEMESMDGVRCVPGVGQLPGEVRALVLVASPAVCAQVLKEVSEAQFNRIWVFSGKQGEPGVEAQIQRLQAAGVSVISEKCPFMFLEPVAGIHAIHRFFARLVGSYPK